MVVCVDSRQCISFRLGNESLVALPTLLLRIIITIVMSFVKIFDMFPFAQPFVHHHRFANSILFCRI